VAWSRKAREPRRASSRGKRFFNDPSHREKAALRHESSQIVM
jgi:hypothetical protein